MSSVHTSSESATSSPPVKAGEVRLEVVVVPVSDVDRRMSIGRSASTKRWGGGSTPTSPSMMATGWCS